MSHVFVLKLRPLLKESVRCLQQDIFAGEPLAFLQQFEAKLLREMLNHIVERHQIELAAIELCQRAVQIILDDVGDDVVVVRPAHSRFLNGFGKSIYTCRCNSGPETAERRKRATPDIKS